MKSFIIIIITIILRAKLHIFTCQKDKFLLWDFQYQMDTPYFII